MDNISIQIKVQEKDKINSSKSEKTFKSLKNVGQADEKNIEKPSAKIDKKEEEIDKNRDSCDCYGQQSVECDEMYDDPMKSSHEYSMCPCGDRKKKK